MGDLIATLEPECCLKSAKEIGFGEYTVDVRSKKPILSGFIQVYLLNCVVHACTERHGHGPTHPDVAPNTFAVFIVGK
jgi:hypothetical protein